MYSHSMVFAQEQPVPFSRPGDQRPDVLEQQPFKPKQQPKLVLPPVAPPEKEEKQLSQGLKFKLNRIKFSGNTVFNSDQLLSVVTSYLGKEIDSFQLQEIKNQVTRYYIQHGYINSGAVIPDQDIARGELLINVIEGGLTQVHVDNTGRLNNTYISERIRLDPQHPFNLGVLQERLYLLQMDPRIKRINANLGPGLNRGESILDIAITEEKPYTLVLQADNHRPPSIGEEQGSLLFQHLNVSGYGDKLEIDARFTEGLDNGYVRYDWPVSADDKIVYAAYDKSDSTVIDEAFQDLDIDIESESETASVGFTMPLFKSSKESYDVSLQLDKRKSKTWINDVPISFAGSGAEDGVSRITVLRIIQNWLNAGNNRVYSLRHTLSVGIDALNSTQHKDQPDSDFTAWLLQFQAARQYPGIGLQSIFRADWQIAFDDLMPMEEFAVGGANTVRGYRENQLVRDHGFVASFEVRKQIYQSTTAQHRIQLVGFTDYGRAWSEQDTGDASYIYSVGTGLRWQWAKTASAELYWAEPLKDVDNPDDSLQDDGIHIKLAAQIL